MLDEADPPGFDLIETVGYPLPVTVICELLGIPAEDQHLFGPWSSDASRMLDGDLDEATIQRGLLAFMSLVNYLNGIFEERRANPRDDLLSALLAAEEEGDKLSEEELRSTVVLLFVAGHETTTNLIGNGTVALLRQRHEWDRLVADPSLAPGAVEEVLRYDGPVHLTGRTATVPTQVGDVLVEPGQGLVTLLAAANRDPGALPRPRPARHHPARQPPPHLQPRHPLLPRRRAGPPRGPGGVQGAHPAVPHPRAHRGARPPRALRPPRLPSRARRRRLISAMIGG